MLDFIEPAQSESMTRCAKTLWPLYAMFIQRKLILKISKRTKNAFHAVKDSPTLICPNHSAHEDPAVMFILSTKVSQKFRFLAARESFGAKDSLYAKWLQEIGCYSVERGAADAHAFKATRALLISGPNKIVIFPEGEVSQQNNYLAEIETGPEHMGLSAFEDLRKHNREQDIYILPLALRYEFPNDVSSELNRAAAKLEKALGYNKQSKHLTERIKFIFSTMLDKNAPTIQKSETTNFEERLSAYRHSLISDAQAFIKADLADELTQVHKIHLLKNRFAEKSWCFEEKPVLIHRHSKQCPTSQERENYNKLRRATNLLVVGDHSFNHELTQEESAELLTILQFEILGKVTLRRPEIVHIDAADPINIRQFASAYEDDKKGGIELLKKELALRLRQSLQLESTAITAS